MTGWHWQQDPIAPRRKSTWTFYAMCTQACTTLKHRTSLSSSCLMERIDHHRSTSTFLSKRWKRVLEFTLRFFIRHVFGSNCLHAIFYPRSCGDSLLTSFWCGPRFKIGLKCLLSTMIVREYHHLCEDIESQPWRWCGSHHGHSFCHWRHKKAWGAPICHHKASFPWTHRIHLTSWTGHLYLQPAWYSSQPCVLHAWQPCQHTHRKLPVSLLYNRLKNILKAIFTLYLRLPHITQVWYGLGLRIHI